MCHTGGYDFTRRNNNPVIRNKVQACRYLIKPPIVRTFNYLKKDTISVVCEDFVYMPQPVKNVLIEFIRKKRGTIFLLRW
jgi:hypothetical protein